MDFVIFRRLIFSLFPVLLADPRLTATGEEQARRARAAWERELSHDVPVPVPQRFYCSPLTRAIRTLELTFENVLPEPPRPVILEVASQMPRCLSTNTFTTQNCREEYGEHTCDKRRTRTELQDEFPGIVFEERFEEEDVLWTTIHESKASVERRAKLVLDRIFQNDHDATCALSPYLPSNQDLSIDLDISITAHSGWINAFLRVIGRNEYALPTGGTCHTLLGRDSPSKAVPFRNSCGCRQRKGIICPQYQEHLAFPFSYLSCSFQFSQERKVNLFI